MYKIVIKANDNSQTTPALAKKISKYTGKSYVEALKDLKGGGFFYEKIFYKNDHLKAVDDLEQLIKLLNIESIGYSAWETSEKNDDLTEKYELSRAAILNIIDSLKNER